MAIRNERQALTAEMRAILKSNIAKHPSAREYIKTLNASSVSALTTAQLFLAADDLGVDCAKLFAGLAGATRSAAQVFAKEDLSGEPEDTPAQTKAVAAFHDAHDKKLLAGKKTVAINTVLAAFGQGPEAFREAIGDLVAAADKPPQVVTEIVEVEKIVEMVVEKVVTREVLVEVAPPPEGCRSAHMPKVVGEAELEGVDRLPVYDAPDAPPVDPFYVWPKAAKVAFTKIRRGQPVFVWGPAGTGKTTFAQQIAARLKRPFVRISFHQDTSAASLVGGLLPVNGEFRWTDSVLVKAMRRPGTIVLLDEVSAARPDAAMLLQGVLETNGGLTIDETGEYVRVAPGVCFILADNTNGTGDLTGQYEGTRRMNRATLDRPTATIEVGYLDGATEAQVIENKTGLDAGRARKLAAFAALTRAEAAKGSLTHGIGLRSLLSWAEAIVDGVGPEGFQACILGRVPHDDVQVIKNLAKVSLNITA